MKLENKHWAMLIAGVVVLFLVYWFFFRKKVAESAYNPYVPIWGIGMGAPSESGYSANQLDPMGIESGFRASGRRLVGNPVADATVTAGGVTTKPCTQKCCTSIQSNGVCAPGALETRPCGAPCMVML